MKPLFFYLTILLFLINSKISFPQTFLDESFEGGVKPDNWNIEIVNGATSWRYQRGGYSDTPEQILSRNPSSAHSGNYNALFQVEDKSSITKLVSKSMDLSSVEKPELRFWYANLAWGDDWDKLKVYFKNGAAQPWMLLSSYNDSTSFSAPWINGALFLPDSLLTNDCYVSFEGISDWGYGLCIDDVTVVEKGKIPKYLKSLNVTHSNTSIIPSYSVNNPLLKMSIDMYGNVGNLILDTIEIEYIGDVNDIAATGARLYISDKFNYTTEYQLGTSQNISGNKFCFNNLNYNLPFGVSNIWFVIDVDGNATHGQTMDARIAANGIKMHLDTAAITFDEYVFPMSGKIAYVIDLDTSFVNIRTEVPLTTTSPTGSRQIQESIFFDNFITDLWDKDGDFEISTPQDMGGIEVGNPDPAYPISGTNVLGTDLMNDGDYTNSIAAPYFAQSPIFDCYYFKTLKVSYYRWLNVESFDSAYFQYSIDSGKVWNDFDRYIGVSDNAWSYRVEDLASTANRARGVTFRYSLGPTDISTTASGWNVDNFAFMGDYIENDVGVVGMTAPIDGCGHTTAETVTILVKNYGPVNSAATIPVSYSFNGGTTWVNENMPGPIASGATQSYTFATKVNLSSPGHYNNIIASTNLAVDEYTGNDQFDTSLYIEPTYNLPYSQNFETSAGYWFAGGTPLWEYGNPSGTKVTGSYSGTHSWATNLDGFYGSNDSAYLEGPCFNMAGIRNPVIEFYINHWTRRNKDGMAMQYSLDGGDSWTFIDTLDYRWDWDWYTNETNIAALGHMGFDSTSNGWVKVRQFLPKTICNYANVKFRFLFQSKNVNYFYEGVAIDDIKIFDAPNDVGAVSVESPVSACELSNSQKIKVAVKNYGIDTLFSGFQIPLRMLINGAYFTNGTLQLTSDLEPLDTVHFKFTTLVNMHAEGDYEFDILTNMTGDNSYYEEPVSNDTVSSTISVYGMPRFDLGPTIGMETIDTLLDPGIDAYTSLEYDSIDWNDGDTIGRYYHVTTEGYYNIFIRNTLGCTKRDTVRVIQSVSDLGVSEILNPVSSCEFPASTDLTVVIENFKVNPYTPAADSLIIVAYSLDENDPVVDSIKLWITGETLGALDTMKHTFNIPVNLSAVDDYNFKVFTILEGDLDYSNDTTVQTISTWGYPDIEFGIDTIFTSQADTITLDAGAGYGSYLWQDNSAGQTYSPPNNASRKCKVTVADIHGCGTDKDSVYIVANDVGIASLTTPQDACASSATQVVRIGIRNYSEDILPIGTVIPVRYTFQGMSPVNETVVTTTTINPNAIYYYNYTATVNMLAVDDYDFVINTLFKNDVDKSNDTLEVTRNVWGYPTVDLGVDTIFTSQADSVVLTANSGYPGYLWNTGATSNVLNVASLTSRWYKVGVNNTHGCTTYDSAYIYAFDIGVSAILTPISDCELSSNENIVVRLTNYSQDTIHLGDQINITYQINSQAPVNEVITLMYDVYPLTNYQYIFLQQGDFSNVQTYQVSANTDIYSDVDPSNDESVVNVTVYGYPDINLGSDTVIRALDYVIDPGTFSSYLWGDGSSGSTLTIDTTGTYSVYVESAYGCGNSDTVHITLLTPDISVTSLLNPVSQCYHNGNVQPQIRIENTGTDTILAGEVINLGYFINNTFVDEQMFTLPQTLYPGDSADLTISDNVDVLAHTTHNFDVYSSFVRDLVPGNDTLTITKNIYPYPIVNLGSDRIVNTKSETLDAGYNLNYTYVWQQRLASGTWQTITSATGAEYNAVYGGGIPIKYYNVVVTESRAGCFDRDTVSLNYFITDISFDSITLPSPICQEQKFNTTLKVRNAGTVSMNAGDKLLVGIKDNSGLHEEREATFNTELASGDIGYLTLNNFSFYHDNSQNVSIYIVTLNEFDLPNDIDHSNDTIKTDVNTMPAPVSSMGGTTDTIKSTLPVTLTPLQSQSAYLWNTGSTASTLSATSQGWHWVSITAANGCSATDSVYVLQQTAIIPLTARGENIFIYPVPADDKLYIISNEQLTNDYSFALINSNGQVIYAGEIYKNIRTNIELNVQYLSSGIYFMKLYNDKESYSRKILIK